ncbi:MAG TPA: hypothetical protein VFA64_16695 [Hyphomicrobiaceae bacterium]|nr:hypothetical protein [Hyphomicrobiaceae bacterium]
MTVTSTASRLLIAALFASAAVPAGASERIAEPSGPSPKIMVPSPTPAGGITGCWAADRSLYGYRLSFCVYPYGDASYTVTGSGLHCHARLEWDATWGGYRFAMSRTSCGHGMDWTADTFTCVFSAGYGHGIGRMPVPSQGGRLDCTYRPAVWGYGARNFSAHRT